MKKGQVLEGIVEKVAFPNKGIITLEDGKQAVVKNAIPGQKVRFSVAKIRSGKCEGRVLEVLERAPQELIEPGCAHFGICGGCTYQNLDYVEQLKLKENQVLELLKPVVMAAGGKEASEWFEPAQASPAKTGYRNKMEFTFGNEVLNGPLTLGMHKRGSFHDIVPVTGCQIVDSDYRMILRETIRFFREKQIPFYHRMKHTGYLRHLLVRKAVKTGEILLDLITTSENTVCTDRIAAEVPENCGEREEGAAEILEKSCAQTLYAADQLMTEYAKMLRALPLTGKFRGILHTVNDGVADTIANEGTTVLYGEDFFYEELLGLKFKITPFSFFQTNSLGAEVLYDTARQFISEAEDISGKVVFDLYSGTGTIAQILAPVAEEVVGVEIVEEAVEAARENAKRNGLSNCKFLAGDVLKTLDTIEEKPDFIVLDPPRDGVHPKALNKIIAYGVKNILYISCKPTSLARDLVALQAGGYEVQRVKCVDMFPFTAGIETVVLLSHKLPNSHIDVKVEFGEGKGKIPLDAITERAKKYQPKVTYKMI